MDTNPQAEVTEQSVEDRLAAKFGEKPDEPPKEPEEKAPEEDQEAPQDAKASEEPEPEPEQEPEEEGEEVEFEGAVYSVPKIIKDALLRQQDYTRKTQEVAERRKQIEEREAHFTEMEALRSAQFEKAVEVHAIAKQLEQFQALDWERLANENPTEYLKLDRAHRQLQQQHWQATQEIQAALGQEQAKTAERRQQMLAKGHEQLAREIKGWGKDMARAVLDHGKSYGFEDRELAQIVDPRMVRVLVDAKNWRDLQASKPQIEKKVLQAKPMQAKARSAQPTQDAAKTQELRERLRKTGDSATAEELLYQRFSRRK